LPGGGATTSGAGATPSDAVATTVRGSAAGAGDTRGCEAIRRDYGTRVEDDCEVPLLRALIAAAALVVCAWFVIGIRQARDTDAAGAIVTSSASLTPPRVAHATALLHAARFLNPDSEIDVLRSQLALRRGDAALAREIALQVTRREPRNVAGWLALGRASRDDPQTFLLALRRLRALAPPVTPAH
jgi:hypothetical protein